jgi:negative regulator of sigma E activity
MEKAHEQLSALLDGELSASESELTVRRIGKDGQLRSVAHRYCLIGDVIRGDLPEEGPVDLCARLAATLDRETPELPQIQGGGTGHWVRRAGGVAVAASVAALAIMSLRGGNELAPEDPPLVVVPDTRTTVPADPGQALARPDDLAQSAGNRDRIVSYYVNHLERAAPLSAQTGLSRIVMSDPLPVIAEPEGRRGFAEESGE